jgi:hypothetical protein
MTRSDDTYRIIIAAARETFRGHMTAAGPPPEAVFATAVPGNHLEYTLAVFLLRVLDALPTDRQMMSQAKVFLISPQDSRSHKSLLSEG